MSAIPPTPQGPDSGANSKSGAKPFMLGLAVAAGLIFVFSIGAMVTLYKAHRGAVATTGAAQSAPDPLAPDENVKGISLPPFALTNQDGVPVTLDAFKGKITILDFFFTNCPFICPRLTAQMSSMAFDLQGSPVQFVSISVDPTRDTPAHLREYAAQKKLDLARWQLLTGDFAVIKNIAVDSLKFMIGEDPDSPIMLPDGGIMHNIRHPGHFVLVGPNGEVLGIYASQAEPDGTSRIPELVARARAAAAELGAKR